MAESSTVSSQFVGPVGPLPPARIAMWFVIVADLMFFVGLLGAFLVLRSGNAALFADHEAGLNKSQAQWSMLVLICSSLTMFIAVKAARSGTADRCRSMLLMTLLLGAAFTGLRGLEYSNALNHHTIVARQSESNPMVLLDGRVEQFAGKQTLDGYAVPLPANADAHLMSQNDIAQLSTRGVGSVRRFILPSEIFQDIRYGPGKNIFYACWYTLTGVHLVHVAVGLIAIGTLLLLSKKKPLLAKHVENVGLFWHFVIAVGVLLFPLIYLW
jgi:heme/copper-type cytochrome/quinol oxidase subunit 3